MPNNLDKLFKIKRNPIDSLTQDIIDFNTLIGNDYKDPTTKEGLTTTYEELFWEECKEYGKAETPIQFLDALCDMWVTGTFLWCCCYEEPYEWDWGGLDYTHEVSVKHLTSLATFGSKLSILEDTIHATSGTLDFEGALAEVNRSNLTKVPTVADFIEAIVHKHIDLLVYSELLHLVCPLEEAVAAQINMIEEKGRYGDITYKVVVDKEGTERIALFAGKDLQANITYGKPKLVKPVTFEEPKLEGYIKEGTL